MAEPTVTAHSLRDRIAAAIHGQPLDGTEHPDDRDCILRCADDVLAVLADADPTDIGGRTLTQIRMLERERDAMQRRTFELAEQIAAARAELPEVLDLLREVVERCVPAVLDAPERPIDDLWGLVWRRLGTAHPRTKEAPDA